MSTSSADTKSGRLSLAHLALLVPWIALVVDAFDEVRDNSLLWHIKAGALQVADGSVLTADPFSLTERGNHWITQSWLAELGYTWLGGDTGLGFVAPMVLLGGTVMMVAIGLYAYKRSGSVVGTAVVLLLTTVLMLQYLVPRPALLSYPLFALVILAWENPKFRWVLPFLFWTWASVHASFAIGLAYLGLRLLAKREWRAWVFPFVSGLATLVTAHGLGVFDVLFGFASAGEYLDLVSEWMTPDFLELDLLPFVAGILILMYGAMRGRIKPSDLIVIGPMLLLAMSAERSVATAWIGLTPFIASSMTWKPSLRPFARPAAAVAVVAILALPFLLIGETGLDEEAFPVAAAAQMENVPTFHDDFAGGYLIWLAGPEFPVYLDDRVELYRERITEFVDVRTGKADWREVFDRDGIEQVLLRAEEPLLNSLTAGGWDETYSDDHYTLLTSP